MTPRIVESENIGAAGQVTRTTRTETAAVPEEHPQRAYQKKKTIFRFYQIVWYLLGVVEILLLFRVVLKVLAANSNSVFVNLIYTLSYPLAQPFLGIFKTSVADSSVFEWSTLVGAAVYALIAYGVVQLLQLVKPTTPEEVEQTVDNP